MVSELTFKVGQRSYTIVRRDDSDRQRPYVCCRSDGKQFRFSEALVRARVRAERAV
jgi:hypothetical protein